MFCWIYLKGNIIKVNIHIMPNEKFTEQFILFVNKYYPCQNHSFYIYSLGKEYTHIEQENVTYCYIAQLNNVVTKEVLKRADRIIVHSFFDKHILFWLSKKTKYSSKFVMVIWGAEIYNNTLKLKNNEVKGLYKLYLYLFEKWKGSIMNRCKLFMTFSCADEGYTRENYGIDGEFFDCLYPPNVDKDLINMLYLPDMNEKKTIKIVLGNSASVTNQHMEALQQLKKYKNDNIKIYCPLSYGDSNNAKKVIDAGKQIFGNKFVPIVEFMNYIEYTKFLAQVDIAIYNNIRQEATGNIEILAFLGKKIYIRKDVALWAHYVERDKCKFFDTIKMDNQTFLEFSTINKEDSIYNHEYIKKIWDDLYIKKIWDKVFV